MIVTLVGAAALVVDAVVLFFAFSAEGVTKYDWTKAAISIMGQLLLLGILWLGWRTWTCSGAGKFSGFLTRTKFAITLILAAVVLFGLSLSTLYISIACPDSSLPTVRGHKLCEKNG